MEEYDLSDRGDCRGCSTLFRILQTCNRQTTETDIAKARAIDMCGWCLRKPPEVTMYNPAVNFPNPIKVEVSIDKDGNITRKPLNLPPIPLEDRWVPCSIERMRVTAFLSAYEPAYSETVVKRLQQFNDELLIQTDQSESL